ncbi:hypothetical protein K8640_13985 [Myxococcus sp. XM-1-1-1]|jgi:hypothetical protein|nr:hypothetical protein [Myxococcus sp. XM-1-1-1]BDT35529.1 hypothetical protein MFMH1_51980 [Myxococcus sp. MH1]
MNNLSSLPKSQSARSPQNVETEEFKLEMLDCGPGYTYSNSEAVCFSCFCGSGCLCGCTGTSDPSA